MNGSLLLRLASLRCAPSTARARTRQPARGANRTVAVLGQAVVTLALALAGAGARPACAADRPERSADICSPGSTIDSIVIQRVNVFDPEEHGENRKFYRAVNILHSPMLTREWVVRSILTIKPGMPCTRDALDEAERSLRAQPFLQDAWVDAMSQTDGKVAVRVRVRDGWSTRLRISISSQGGAGSSTFKVSENNLFGTGWDFGWDSTRDQDRSERAFHLSAPTLFGSHWQLELQSGNTSDGENKHLLIQLPFWRLDARHAFYARYDDVAQISKVYVGNEAIDRYDSAKRNWQVQKDWALRQRDPDRTLRWGAWLAGDRQRWVWQPRAKDGVQDFPELQPRDRDLTLAGLSVEWRRLDYRKVQFYDSSRRVQDLDFGSTLGFQVGNSIPGVSQDSGGTVWLFARRAWDLADDAALFLTADRFVSRVRGERFDVITQLDAKLYLLLAARHTLLFRVFTAAGSSLEGDRRFLLGGDTGLRGYDSRSFSGSNELLMTAEQRYFAPWEAWHLFKIGLVGFAEIGGTWEEHEPLAWSTLHRDIGMGMRVELVRAASRTTLQLNLALPLDPLGDGEGARRPLFSFLTTTGY